MRQVRTRVRDHPGCRNARTMPDVRLFTARSRTNCVPWQMLLSRVRLVNVPVRLPSGLPVIVRGGFEGDGGGCASDGRGFVGT